MLVALLAGARGPWDSSHGPTNPSIEWLVASKITWDSGATLMHVAQLIGRRETTRLCRACPAFSMSSCFKFYDRLDFLGRLRYIEGSYHSPTAHLIGRRGGKGTRSKALCGIVCGNRKGILISVPFPWKQVATMV